MLRFKWMHLEGMARAPGHRQILRLLFPPAHFPGHLLLVPGEAKKQCLALRLVLCLLPQPPGPSCFFIWQTLDAIPSILDGRCLFWKCSGDSLNIQKHALGMTELSPHPAISLGSEVTLEAVRSLCESPAVGSTGPSLHPGLCLPPGAGPCGFCGLGDKYRNGFSFIKSKFCFLQRITNRKVL